MNSEIKLIVPIMPGKTEAWRRFWQELTGSRDDEFTRWCQSMGIDLEKVQLHDTLGGAVAILDLAIITPTCMSASLKEIEASFTRWFYRQIKALHGLDLSLIDLEAPSLLEAHQIIYHKAKENYRGKSIF